MASIPDPQGTSSNPTSGDVLLEYLRRQIAEFQRQAPRVRDTKPDSVHQMRMSARRLRAVLRSARAMFEPGNGGVRDEASPEDGSPGTGNRENLSGPELRAELKWFSGVLGKARDPEVIRDRITALLSQELDALLMRGAAERIDEVLDAAAREARDEVLAALASDRYTRLVQALAALQDNPLLSEKAARPARKGLAKLVKKDVRRLRRKADALKRQNAGDAKANAASDINKEARNVAFHGVRKAAKRVRYVAEAASLAKEESADRLEDAAHTIQKILGQHQDSVVAREHLAELGSRSSTRSSTRGQNGFTFGRLHALEERRADEAEKAFFKAWKAFPKGSAPP
jgi:CHAD domain-containing protein